MWLYGIHDFFGEAALSMSRNRSKNSSEMDYSVHNCAVLFWARATFFFCFSEGSDFLLFTVFRGGLIFCFMKKLFIVQIVHNCKFDLRAYG